MHSRETSINSLLKQRFIYIFLTRQNRILNKDYFNYRLFFYYSIVKRKKPFSLNSKKPQIQEAESTECGAFSFKNERINFVSGLVFI